jgi:carbon monoxide dehydrogenase subunit G
MRAVGTIRVERDPEEVFDFLELVEHETSWRQSVTGSRYVDTARPTVGTAGETVVSMGSRTVRMAWTVVELAPGRRVAWELDGDPWRGGGSYSVAPAEGGTTVTAELAVRLHGITRAAEPLLWLQFRNGLRGDLRRLKQRMEQHA